MKTKLVLYLILLMGLNSHAQIINVSTGIDASGNALTAGTVDPFWKIASSPNPPGTPAKASPSYPPTWEVTPIATTNAMIINPFGDCCGNLAGIYTFERDIVVPVGTTNLSCNFSIAYDDALVSLELVRPDASTIPLTATPTTPYHLSVPITNSVTNPASGTWKIRAVIDFIDNIAFYLASGNVTLSSGVTLDCGNTFVKEINPLDATKPNIFKIPNGDFYTTSSYFPNILINRFDANGTAIWTQSLNFGISDPTLTVTDLIVDASDNQIVGVANSSTGTIIFKYDEVTNIFTWINRTGNYRAFNIHETSPTLYTVTGADSASSIEIFEIDQSTGSIGGYQKKGIPGEFYSTYDSGNMYGSCRYYADSATQFFPSLYKYDATGTNLWVKTYIRDTPTARIYPVAPIVDGSSLVELSAGVDDNFDLVNAGTGKIFLLKTDLNGTLNWTKEITVSGYTGFEAIKLINATDGYYLVLNRYTPSGDRNLFFVIKTDKNGNVLWANRYGLPSAENYVTGGYEKGGYLYLTGMSTSYSAISHMIVLKLNSLGKTDASCPFINSVSATSTVYANVETPRPTVNGTSSFSTTAMSGSNSNLTYTESIKCSTPCSSVTQVISSQCGTTLAAIDQYINANSVPGFVSGTDIYRFEVVKMIAGVPSTLPADTQIKDNTYFPKFKLTSLPQFDFDTSYQIRVAVQVGGVWSPYGAPCIVTSPVVYTQVQASQCGTTIPTMGTSILANIVPFAPPYLPYLGDYLFEVTNMTTMAVETIPRNLRDFNMNLAAFTPGFATYNTTYNVRVAVRKYDGTYMPFGPMCTITTPSIPTTQVRASQCNTVVPSTSTLVYADLVAGATNYKFKLSSSSPFYSQEFVGIGTGALSRKFKLSNFSPAPMLAGGTMYDIEVCVSMDGGITYGAYGPICKLSTPAAFKSTTIEKETIAGEFNAVAYPNPSDTVFNLSISTPSEDPIEIKVYDMLGKQIETRSITIDEASSVSIGAEYASGVYNIIITQGEHLQTIKVIKR